MKFSDFSNEKYRLNSFSVRIKYQPTVPNFLDSSLGSTDISAIGDGTVTGAISSIYSNLGTQATYSLNGTTLSITTKE